MVRGLIIGSLLAAGLAVTPTAARGAGAPAADAGARSGSVAPVSTPRQPTGQVAGGASASTPTRAPDPERARLAAELDRANADIDALKRSPRGIRDDYRLRNRMADAEALARRLTELDARAARLHPAAAPSTARVGVWPPADVPVSPGDDRADLEAKADILTDQAGRLTAEANRLDVRIRDLRARRELRRRAGQLEHDPFSPLEQAKGRVVIAAGRLQAPGPSETKNGAGPEAPGTGISAPSGGGDSRGATPATLTPPTSHGTGATSSDGTLDATGSVAAQLRTVLDPAALAEIRRLEVPGSSPSSIAALENALGALRSRAAELNRSAAALRARATTGP